MLFTRNKREMPRPEEALPGRDERMPVPPPCGQRQSAGTALPRRARADRSSGWDASGAPSASSGSSRCLHHRRRLRRAAHAEPDLPGSLLGMTGHTEVVLVVFDPAQVSLRGAARVFWENHDPTQGMRQGNDVGTQYRSGDLHDRRRAQTRRRGIARRVPEAADRGRLRRDHDRDPARRRRSTTRRATTSSTWRRTRGYCGIGGTGCRARWARRAEG